MIYRIRPVDATSTRLAAVRRPVAWSELTAVLPRLFNEVYSFMATARVNQNGHNVCIYRECTDEGAELEVGVQVASSFVGNGQVMPSHSPAGRAIWTVHAGAYDGLPEAHQAIEKWCETQHLAVANVRWEVYGDWNDDPRQLHTDVFHLVAEGETAYPLPGAQERAEGV